ncbi:MAG: alpha/beta fold hydrolase [Pseudomonadota bacterium]
MSGRNIVLIHGAWHGGWCWDAVRPLLAEHGHTVSAPTLTGLADKAHLLTPDVSIETFVEDVASHLSEIADDGIVLVGHSFAGTIL